MCYRSRSESNVVRFFKIRRLAFLKWSICIGLPQFILVKNLICQNLKDMNLNSTIILFALSGEIINEPNVINAALVTPTMQLSVPANANPGTYNATVTVINSITGCVSASIPL